MERNFWTPGLLTENCVHFRRLPSTMGRSFYGWGVTGWNSWDWKNRRHWKRLFQWSVRFRKTGWVQRMVKILWDLSVIRDLWARSAPAIRWILCLKSSGRIRSSGLKMQMEKLSMDRWRRRQRRLWGISESFTGREYWIRILLYVHRIISVILWWMENAERFSDSGGLRIILLWMSIGRIKRQTGNRIIWLRM